MIVVFDANVIISALVFGGLPRKVIENAIERRDTFATCNEILSEVTDVLQRPHIVAVVKKAGLSQPSIERYEKKATRFFPIPIPQTVRDPDDDVIIGCAVAANADIIVTGDKDLLDLGRYKDIRILSVAETLKTIYEENGTPLP